MSFLYFTCTINAQVKITAQKKAVTNLTDNKGIRIGAWWIVTPERMGEVGYTEFGHYDHGNKTGRWYKMDNENNLTSIESYKSNVLNGESRYFEKGKLTCVGHYRSVISGNIFDTIVVVDPRNNSENITPILAENATQRHGSWKYYDPQTGKLVREEDYQVDNLIYHKDYAVVSTDSIAYQAYLKKLPHNKHSKNNKSKSFSYINY
jgi:hypothetical protein